MRGEVFMLDGIIHSLTLYYGLDWLAMALGMTGYFFVTNKNYWDFLCSITGCLCGLSVAFIAGQYGFIIHNTVLICMMVRGFILWRRDTVSGLPQAAE